METRNISRRNFLGKTAVTTTLSLGGIGLVKDAFVGQGTDKPRREVWIASFSQAGMSAPTPESMTGQILEKLKEVLAYRPDFVCLPEAFPFEYVEKRFTLTEMVKISDEIQEQIAAFSRENKCYTVCPLYTSVDGKFYNSAIVFDREGREAGRYNKIHETEGVINMGVTPGALYQPAIQTEFGPVGVQICFDMRWDDGWKMLKEQGAKIIFWPSAFSGGDMVNTRAWQNHCIVVSSPNKYIARLCDISGETIASTGIWNSNVFCAPVNMEKAFLHTWPYVKRFKEIEKKYGRTVRITNFHEEEFSIIESLSPDIYVKDILEEFDLKTFDEHIGSADQVQKKARL